MQELLQSFGLPLVMLGLAVSAFSAFLVFARNYKKCPPNKVLVPYGRKRKNEQGQQVGYRLITGGSAFIMPLLEQYEIISLETFPVESSVAKTPNVDGVPVNVEATANVKVSSNPKLLAAAVERILGKKQQDIHAMLKNTLDGLLRQIIGTLTVEEIIKDRERLAQQVLQGAQAELNKLGFEIDVFVVNRVWDEEGYIDALGAKRTAEVKRDATIAQAEASREAMIKKSNADKEGETARLSAMEQVAQANRDLALKQAGFKRETETADAEANMAKALKEAEIDKVLRQRRVAAQEAETQAQIALAEQEAARKEKELIATTIKPAEAAAKAATITANGNASAAVKQAEAVRSQAEAEKAKLTLEGEGRAIAEAARHRELGLAEAQVAKAKGESEGVAISAKLTAEADGLRKKNEALAQMGEAARMIIVLERLPEIIDKVGDSGEKIVSAAFKHIGDGVSRIDSVHLIDLGGGNGNGNGNGSDPISRFASSIPRTVFEVVAQAKALGFDTESILEKLGIPPNALTGVLGQLKNAASASTALALESKSDSHDQ